MEKQNKPFSPAENHSYNVNVSVCVGHPGKATLLKEFFRSYNYFKDHNGKQIDGFYWFFIRMDKLTESYPEFSEKSMYRWISEMEDAFLIASRKDLNQHGYDKTRWFTVNVAAYDLLVMGDKKGLEKSEDVKKFKDSILKMRIALNSQNGKSNSQNGKSNSQNGKSNSQNGTTIQPLLNPLLNPLLDPHSCINVKTEVLTNSEKQLNFVEPAEITFKDQERLKQKKVKLDKQISEGIQAIEYLNEMAGRNLPADPKGRGQKNVAYVVALLRKGYNLDEIKLMIDFKCWEWRGTTSEKYLDPITMFYRHGERYIQTAKEAVDNQSFQAALKKAKAKDENKSTQIKSGHITQDIADRLKNW